MEAQIQVQMDDMKMLLQCQQPDQRDKDSVVEYDEDLAEDAPEIIRSCRNLLGLLPMIFPLQQCPETAVRDLGNWFRSIPRDDQATGFFLHHGDLSLNNILVDPHTLRISGIVDWESVNTCPLWEALEYPEFLIGRTIEEEPPLLGGEDKENILLVEGMEDWEKTALRRRFDEHLQKVRGVACNITGAGRDVMDKWKGDFKKLLMLVEFSTNMVEKGIAELNAAMGLEARNIGT